VGYGIAGALCAAALTTFVLAILTQQHVGSLSQYFSLNKLLAISTILSGAGALVGGASTAYALLQRH